MMQAMSVHRFDLCTAIHVQLKPSPNHGNMSLSPIGICRLVLNSIRYAYISMDIGIYYPPFNVTMVRYVEFVY